ncbi:hypothetical protein HZS_4905 [Henneguya salminicola]|nr:hypothetical protein HZS_4905 [Henneguya salminicola]
MDELVCNFKKCRKPLRGISWVTSCSHIFCDEDGTREFGKAFICPACDTNLSGKLDIVRTDLTPTEQYKSMVLAGHKPENIMEISSRALAFWSYQMHQEKAFQMFIAQKAKDARTQVENYYNSVTMKMQHEINTLRSDIASKSKEIEETKTKLAETSEKLQERVRQYQKLQNMNEALKRRSLNLTIENEGGKFKPDPSPQLRACAMEVRLNTAEEHFFRPQKYMPKPRFKQEHDDNNYQGEQNTPSIISSKNKKSVSGGSLLDTSNNIPYPPPTHIDLSGND